jgi:outer membrane protein OmpA-like peptidoglycan-associated protein
MGSPINTEAWESEPSLSADGNIIYFSSDRKGGFGGSDIYVSYKTENEIWSKPVPLPKPINNEFNTESAFMHPDGKTLYFRAQGLPGLGGYDLYISRLNEKNEWSEPLNMGVGINTERDEGALIIDLNGKYGYFASDGKQAGGIENFGGVDIYRFEVPDKFKPQPVTYVKAKVIDMNTGKSITADIQVQDLKTHKSFNKSTTDDDGTFLVCLPLGKSYALNVSKDKYTFYSEHFSLNEVKSKNDPYVLEIKLQKLGSGSEGKPGKPIILRNIFFDTGSSTLRDESTYELQKLIDFLNVNDTTMIRINGHTDNVGKTEDNLKLSIDRAKSVYDYLINKGILPTRLSFKGYGETNPLTGNDTEEDRQQNRRIEFEITTN